MGFWPMSTPSQASPYATVNDLESVAMSHHSGELFNPPALTNFIGSLQAAVDVLAIRYLTFPPFSHGDAVIGRLTVNGINAGPAGVPITFRWRPDCIRREAVIGGLQVASHTVMGVGKKSVTVALTVTNSSNATRQVRMRVRTGEGVIRSDHGWSTPYSPQEKPVISVTPWEGTPPPQADRVNRRRALGSGLGLVCESQSSQAASLQACDERPSSIDERGMEFSAELAGGETKTWNFFTAVGSDSAELESEFAAWRADPARELSAAEQDWNAELAAVFTPGNNRYSGWLPRLETTNPALRTIFLTSVLNTIYFRRETPRGRTYTTLMPCYWVTTSFINDWSLNAWALVLLDPECVRRQVEHWLEHDIHRHFGTEYVTGGDAGNWYSCNDFAMTRLISVWLRFSGEWAWLDHVVAGRTIRAHLERMALHYRDLDRGSGLADFGDRNSLLECVGSYVHEVASLNAAAVWNLRETAVFLTQAGDTVRATEFRAQASALATRLQSLYAPGGWWRCRRPDGRTADVRHAWDFVHTINLLEGDLSGVQLAEMVGFFERELQTPAWMRALAPADDDVDFSSRPDHQWNGSYPAWVAFAGCALVKAGRADLLQRWLPGLAASANQGPYSQAHLVESYAAPESGGARKAPAEWPFINDWALLAGGAFFEMVVAGIFGVDPGLDRLEAKSQLALFDGGAALHGLRYQAASYRVDANGVAREP